MGNEPPEGYVIKGNDRSMKYHVPRPPATAAPSPRSGSTARRRPSKPASSAPSAEPSPHFLARPVRSGRDSLEFLLIWPVFRDFGAAVNICPHFRAFLVDRRNTREKADGQSRSPRGSRVDWVDAAPFRAQLRHLMAAFSLPVEDVAAAAGISARLAAHLVYGRNGRPARRISPDTARRLLRLSDDQVRLLRPAPGALRTGPAPARAAAPGRLGRPQHRRAGRGERPRPRALAATATTCSQLLTFG